MKKKSLKSKLVLSKETITNLNMSNVKGGGATIEYSCAIECRATREWNCY